MCQGARNNRHFSFLNSARTSRNPTATHNHIPDADRRSEIALLQESSDLQIRYDFHVVVIVLCSVGRLSASPGGPLGGSASDDDPSLRKFFSHSIVDASTCGVTRPRRPEATTRTTLDVILLALVSLAYGILFAQKSTAGDGCDLSFLLSSAHAES